MLKKDIGINAGTIWRHLYEKGKLSIIEIEELTNYKSPLLFMALGWLSKEDKISFFEEDGKLYVELNNMSEIYF